MNTSIYAPEYNCHVSIIKFIARLKLRPVLNHSWYECGSVKIISPGSWQIIVYGICHSSNFSGVTNNVLCLKKPKQWLIEWLL